MEERLIGYEEPTKEDVAEIKEYEASKKNEKLTLVPLSELTKRDLALEQTSGYHSLLDKETITMVQVEYDKKLTPCISGLEKPNMT